MKLTIKERKLVKEYAKKLVGNKKLNESDDEYEKVFNSINWDDITNTINKITGLKLNYEYKRKGQYVELFSPDVVKYCGLFKKVLSRCNITFFNNSLFILPEEEDRSNKQIFWAGVHLSYEHKDGGSNGMKIFELYVLPDGKIKTR